MHTDGHKFVVQCAVTDARSHRRYPADAFERRVAALHGRTERGASEKFSTRRLLAGLRSAIPDAGGDAGEPAAGRWTEEWCGAALVAVGFGPRTAPPGSWTVPRDRLRGALF